MKCPVCGKDNATPAHILGHGGKGVPKTITKADRAARAARMAAAQKMRWPTIMRRIAIVPADGGWTAYEMEGSGPRFGRKVFTGATFEEVDAFVGTSYPGANRPAQRREDGSVYWIQSQPSASPVIEVTFTEGARLAIFNGELPVGQSQEIDVAAGEVWYAPRSEMNQLMGTSLREVQMEGDSCNPFLDLGTISRSTDEPAHWAKIRTVNKGTGIVPRLCAPHYKAQPSTFEPTETTHEDFL